MQQPASKQNRIPEQQGIGHILPPVPVGLDASNAPPLPPGAMSPGTTVQVGKYKVIIHSFFSEGGFAHVYTARIEGKTGYVVLKRIAVPDGERLKMVEKEIAFMRRLGDHKNIVRYYESRIDALPVGGFEAFILMEYCPGGGVIDLMNRRLQQRLTEPEILKIFSDVAEALAYMHYCNPPVLHRDLKVENILILNQDHFKLCDFGSASLSKGDYIPTSLREIQKVEDDIQRHTTLQYRAPEMIDVYQKKPINEKADIWAMGVLLYKLCYYTTPFEEEGQLAILNARYTIPSSPLFSEGLRRLIISMLQEDQHRRPTIYQVLNAVCHLRGIDCPIRDIYTEPIITPPFGQQQQSSSYTPSSSENGSIFEKVPSPAQDLPNIKPMRRGRPTKSTPPPEPSSPPTQQQQQRTFDPFDPSHVNKNTTSSPSSNHTSSTFQNSFVPEPSPKRDSFQSNFVPKTSPKRDSFQNSFVPEPSPKQSPKRETTYSFVPEKNKRESVVPEPSHHSTPEPQHATKIQVEPSTSTKVQVDPTPEKAQVEEEEQEEDDDDMPKINRGVSSSIEARFMAIKNASKPPKKNKPAPPPKPARFRTQQTVPSVDDFEHKFPTLEELDKSLI